MDLRPGPGTLSKIHKTQIDTEKWEQGCDLELGEFTKNWSKVMIFDNRNEDSRQKLTEKETRQTINTLPQGLGDDAVMLTTITTVIVCAHTFLSLYSLDNKSHNFCHNYG